MPIYYLTLFLIPFLNHPLVSYNFYGFTPIKVVGGLAFLVAIAALNDSENSTYFQSQSKKYFGLFVASLLLSMAANGFEAGLIAERFRPHVIVLDVAGDPQDAAAICRNIKDSADLQAARVIATGSKAGLRRGPRFAAGGFDGWLAKPYSTAQLADAIEKVTNLIG